MSIIASGSTFHQDQSRAGSRGSLRGRGVSQPVQPRSGARVVPTRTGRRPAGRRRRPGQRDCPPRPPGDTRARPGGGGGPPRESRAPALRTTRRGALAPPGGEPESGPPRPPDACSEPTSRPAQSALSAGPATAGGLGGGAHLTDAAVRGVHWGRRRRRADWRGVGGPAGTRPGRPFRGAWASARARRGARGDVLREAEGVRGRRYQRRRCDTAGGPLPVGGASLCGGRRIPLAVPCGLLLLDASDTEIVDLGDALFGRAHRLVAVQDSRFRAWKVARLQPLDNLLKVSPLPTDSIYTLI